MSLSSTALGAITLTNVVGFDTIPWKTVAPPSHEEEREINEKLVALEQHADEQTARALQGLVPIPARLWDMDVLDRVGLYSGFTDRYYALQKSYRQRTGEARREFRQRSQATPVQQSSGSNYSTATQKQPMQQKQGSPTPNPTPKQPMQTQGWPGPDPTLKQSMQNQGSPAPRDGQTQASQPQPSSPPKRLPLAVDEDFLSQMRALMGSGPSEEGNPPCTFPVLERNPRQRGGPYGRSSNEIDVLSSRGLCFRCGIKGHRATELDAPCKGHPVTAAAAIPALARASSARSSDYKAKLTHRASAEARTFEERHKYVNDMTAFFNEMVPKFLVVEELDADALAVIKNQLLAAGFNGDTLAGQSGPAASKQLMITERNLRKLILQSYQEGYVDHGMAKERAMAYNAKISLPKEEYEYLLDMKNPKNPLMVGARIGYEFKWRLLCKELNHPQWTDKLPFQNVYEAVDFSPILDPRPGSFFAGVKSGMKTARAEFCRRCEEEQSS